VANYYFGETGMLYLYPNRAILPYFRLAVLGFVMMGALAELPLVWNTADMLMGLMALLNLVAILLLSPIAFKVMKDYLDQLKGDQEPTFDKSKFPELEGKIAEDVW
jgi:AGCS family alanine or glycine:cation symporter